MTSFLRRDPLVVGCCAVTMLVCFVAFASVTVQTVAFLLILSFAVTATVLSYFPLGRFIAPYRRTVVVASLMALVCIVSCFYICQHRNKEIRALCQENENVRIEGYAIEKASAGAFGYTKIAVTQLNGKECDFRFLLQRTNVVSPDPYTLFSAEVALQSDNDSLVYYKSENIVASGTVLSLTDHGTKVSSLNAFFYNVSHRIHTVINTHFEDDAASLSSALLLGRQSALDDDVERDFITLGISHMLAISGLHLSILITGLLFLLGRLRFGKALRLIICSFAILFFAGICGFTPSILRAGLMSVCLLIADFVGQKGNGLRSLAISAAVILLFCPYLIYSASFLMSALATLGILLLYPVFTSVLNKEKHPKTARRIAGYLFAQFCLTLSVCLLTLPVTYTYFKSISLAGFLANPIFVPLITLLLYLLPLALLLLPIPFVGSLATALINKLSAIILNIASLGRYCKDMYCYIPPFILVVVIILVLSIPLFTRKYGKKFLLPAISALTVSLALCIPISLSGTERLSYFNNQQNQSLLLADGNTVALIETDTPIRQNAYTALTEAKTDLHQTGIDILILTHYHNDSIGFAKYLFTNTYIDTVYLPETTDENDLLIQKEICHLALEQRVECVTYADQSPFGFRDFTLRIHREDLHRSSHPAMAIEIQSQSGRVLAADPAVFELDGIGAPDLSGVDQLILFSSSPIDKYPLPHFEKEETVHAVYASKEQYGIIGGNFANQTVLSMQNPRVRILFSNKTKS